MSDITQLRAELRAAIHVRDHYLDASEAWRSRALAAESERDEARARVAASEKGLEQAVGILSDMCRHGHIYLDKVDAERAHPTKGDERE